MTKNIETADKIVKLTLSMMTLILYFVKVIQGPFASALAILSVAVVLLHFMKVLFSKSD
jgi:type IV secretory pathway VirB2 component (pilin)